MEFVLPAPTGPHPVGVTDAHLTDAGRPAGPVAAGAGQGAEGPGATGPDSTGPGAAGLGTVPGSAAGPVVLFSPGLGMARGTTTALVSDLASHGYTVVTVDHPGEGSPVAFPDGRVRTDGAVTEEMLADQAGMAGYIGRALDARVADLSFVLDSLPAPTGGIGVFGHSLGGTAACEAMSLDARFAAGANLDGPLGASPEPRPDNDPRHRPGPELTRSVGAGSRPEPSASRKTTPLRGVRGS